MKKFLVYCSFSFLLLIVPRCVSAATYYVAKAGSGGSDANSCATAQTHTTGKLTVLAGLACLSAGDTLFIKAGTYSENFLSTSWVPGTSWSAATRISAYLTGTTYDAVTLDHSGTSRVIYLIGATKQYMIFEGLTLDGTGGDTSNGDVVKLEKGAHHIRFLNSEIKNGLRQGILVTTSSSGSPSTSFNEFLNLHVHTNGFDGVTANDNLNHGLYISGPDNLVAHCNIHDNRAYGVHVYNGDASFAHRNVIRHNRVYSHGKNGILIGSGSDNQAYRNIVYNNTGRGFQVGYGATINNQVFHNTVYNNASTGIAILASATDTIHKNNVYYNNTLANTDAGTGTVAANNRTTDPSFVNATAADFGLQAGSPAIDAGTTIAGEPYNGAAPDQGAFETYTCTAVVPATSTDTIVITCENNLAAPLLPASGCTGFTARKNATSNALVSCDRKADNQIALTLTDTYINTDTADWSYATGTGNVTNSANIGGVLRQRLNAVTNQTATNLVSSSTPVLTQVSYRFSCYGGTEAAPDCVLPINTGVSIPSNACVRARFLISNTVNNFGASGFTCFSQKNGSGGYAAVTNGPTALAGLSFATGTGTMPPELIAGSAPTEHLAGAGTFVAGGVMLSALEIPSITLASGQDTEVEFALCVGGGHADGDYFDLRVYSAGGVALGAYTQTGRITIDTDGYVSQWGAP